jgi:N-methylhydantoinase B
VALEVTQGKVSLSSAHGDYGVALLPAPDGSFGVDLAETQSLREELRAKRGFVPFFDRGPGYRQLSGRDYAEVDLV